MPKTGTPRSVRGNGSPHRKAKTHDLDVAMHELTHRNKYTVDGLLDLEADFRT